MSNSRHRIKNDGQIAGLYDLKDTIGRGHFAVVKLAKHVFTGEQVAVKVIDKTKLDAVSKEHLFQEVRCMKLVQHPNVVRLYEVIDTQTKLYLILELGDGGDMFDYIMKHENGLDEVSAQNYFKQIVQAINYCHKLHVVHRDLKPENVVFFQKDGIVKLTDFGFSNKFVPGRHLETSCGSLAYSAPEILLGDAYDPPAVDLWSLGVILYMLVVGEAPFAEANDSETLTMIMDCKFKIPKHISPPCQDLISKMLVRDPGKRISLDEIERHSWLRGSGPSPVPTTPLISRELLSDEDNKYIMQRMVDGKIATNDEILHAIDKDPYSHLAATYFLLAERLLRKQHALLSNHQWRSDGKPILAPLALSPRVQSADSSTRMDKHRTSIESLVSPIKSHPSGGLPAGSSPLIPLIQQKPAFPHRKISLIHEESIEEDEEEMDSCDPIGSSSPPRTRMARFDKVLTYSKDDTSQSEESDHSRSSSLDRTESPVSRMQPITMRRNTTMRPLKTVRSSPNMLNEIYEEGESDEDGMIAKRFSPPKFTQRNTLAASPEVLRKYEHRSQRKRLSPSLRGASASSSDASDNDEADPNRKRSKEKLKNKGGTGATLFPRRDSSDHSSDTDAGPGPGGLGGAGRLGSGAGASGSSGGGGGGGGGSRRGGGGGSGGASDPSNDRDQDNNKGGKRHSSSSSSETNRHSSNHAVKGNNNSNNSSSAAAPLKFPQNGIDKCNNSSDSEHMDIKISNIRIDSKMHYFAEEEEDEVGGEEEEKLVKSTVYIMNEENKYKGKVIHVRSKEFNDLRSRFSDSLSENSAIKEELGVESIGGFKTKDIVGNVKFRRRSKDYSNIVNNGNCNNVSRATLSPEKVGCEADEDMKENGEVNDNDGHGKFVKKGKNSNERGRPARLLVCKGK